MSPLKTLLIVVIKTFFATLLAGVIPALLHDETPASFGPGVSVVRRRGNRWDKPKWRCVRHVVDDLLVETLGSGQFQKIGDPNLTNVTFAIRSHHRSA